MRIRQKCRRPSCMRSSRTAQIAALDIWLGDEVGSHGKAQTDGGAARRHRAIDLHVARIADTRRLAIVALERPVQSSDYWCPRYRADAPNCGRVGFPRLAIRSGEPKTMTERGRAAWRSGRNSPSGKCGWRGRNLPRQGRQSDRQSDIENDVGMLGEIDEALADARIGKVRGAESLIRPLISLENSRTVSSRLSTSRRISVAR